MSRWLLPPIPDHPVLDAWLEQQRDRARAAWTARGYSAPMRLRYGDPVWMAGAQDDLADPRVLWPIIAAAEAHRLHVLAAESDLRDQLAALRTRERAQDAAEAPVIAEACRTGLRALEVAQARRDVRGGDYTGGPVPWLPEDRREAVA